jgi:hypothetical protein
MHTCKKAEGVLRLSLYLSTNDDGTGVYNNLLPTNGVTLMSVLVPPRDVN